MQPVSGRQMGQSLPEWGPWPSFVEPQFPSNPQQVPAGLTSPPGAWVCVSECAWCRGGEWQTGKGGSDSRRKGLEFGKESEP